MDGYVALTRARQRAEEQARAAADEYEDFLAAVVNLLFSSIFFEANLPRRSTALQALLSLHEIVIARGVFNPRWMNSVNDGVERLLYIVENDSYENNKESALSVLDKFWPLTSVDSKNLFGDRDILGEVLSSCDSPNPIRSTTAAYQLRLLTRTKSYGKTALETLSLLSDRLAAQVAVAQRDLSEAAREHPMFGLLFCMRAVVIDSGDLGEGAREWAARVRELCAAVSAIVSEVLNSDSPEGQMGSGCDGQTLLLCCWRSSKEVSHLLAALIDKLPHGELGAGAILSVADVKSIGDFFTRLLGTTVHRGAFEQVGLGTCNLKYSLEINSIDAVHAGLHRVLNDLRIHVALGRNRVPRLSRGHARRDIGCDR